MERRPAPSSPCGRAANPLFSPHGHNPVQRVEHQPEAQARAIRYVVLACASGWYAVGEKCGLDGNRPSPRTAPPVFRPPCPRTGSSVYSSLTLILMETSSDSRPNDDLIFLRLYGALSGYQSNWKGPSQDRPQETSQSGQNSAPQVINRPGRFDQ
jgi:hypothetical protein